MHAPPTDAIPLQDVLPLQSSVMMVMPAPPMGAIPLQDALPLRWFAMT